MRKRNDVCSCGSGKKYKKCCLSDDRRLQEARIFGIFDPDMPIMPEDKGYGNYLANDGHWYVIRSGHDLPRVPKLRGDRIDQAIAKIKAWKEKQRSNSKVGLQLAQLLAFLWPH